MNTLCEVEECEKPRSGKYCSMHYARLKRHGSVHAVKIIHGDRMAGFLQKVDKSGDCWEWTAAKFQKSGYGQFNYQGTPITAHRAAWELLVGPIPEGMFIDHICHNRGCVNPEHLRLATPKQNNENHSGAVRPNSATGVRGVSRRGEYFAVHAQHNYKRHEGGTYTTLEAAAQAAVDLRNRLFTFNDADRRQSAEIDPSQFLAPPGRERGTSPLCGTTTAYRYGCRCEQCRGAHREYNRQAREKKLQTLPIN